MEKLCMISWPKFAKKRLEIESERNIESSSSNLLELKNSTDFIRWHQSSRRRCKKLVLTHIPTCISDEELLKTRLIYQTLTSALFAFVTLNFAQL